MAITHFYIFIRWGHYEIKRGEPLRIAELDHTATSLLKSGEEDIGAGMSEPPKAKHQKETLRDFCVLEEEKKEATDLQKKRSNPKPSQNIQLSNFRNITHSSQLSLSLSLSLLWKRMKATAAVIHCHMHTCVHTQTRVQVMQGYFRGYVSKELSASII